MRHGLLIYNIKPEKLTKLRVLCMRLGIKIRPVEKNEYGLTIQELLEDKCECSCEGNFDDEMLVMCGFDNRTVDEFLMGMRTNRIPPISLKAMMTETNAQWTSFQLRDELIKEHEAMKAGRQAAHQK